MCEYWPSIVSVPGNLCKVHPGKIGDCICYFQGIPSLKILIVLIYCLSVLSRREIALRLNDKENDTKMAIKRQRYGKEIEKRVTTKKKKKARQDKYRKVERGLGQ